MQAAKVMGWAAGLGATAFGAYHLTQQLQSVPSGLDGASSSAKSSDAESMDTPSSSELDHMTVPPISHTRDLLLAAGGACGLLGVAGGAFGFHGLKRHACFPLPVPLCPPGCTNML